MSEPIFSVSEINEYVRMVLDGDIRLRSVWLRGEISNFTNHYRTGHFYFSLKDENSSLRAVMFRGSNSKLNFVPENGMRVLAHGEIRAYPRDGQTQIVVSDMQPDGMGSLALAFEQLRRKLEAEGLFAAERKRPLPRYPRRIGVITSATGAAIHDIIRITGRRYPLAELILFPALVQGEGAAASLALGVEFFNSVPDLVDVIILGRGGGSMEELWAFNDEMLARTVATSRLPVISAVGHESDVTICDFVADRRAPTPSGAAEIAVPDQSELQILLDGLDTRLARAVSTRLERAKDQLVRRAAHRFFTSPIAALNERKQLLAVRGERLHAFMAARMEKHRSALGAGAARLQALSPLAVLSRGYAIVTDGAEAPTPITAAKLRQGQDVRLHFSDGTALARVQDIALNQTEQSK